MKICAAAPHTMCYTLLDASRWLACVLSISLSTLSIYRPTDLSFQISHLHIWSIVDLANVILQHFIISHKHHDCTYCVCVCLPLNISANLKLCARARVWLHSIKSSKYIQINNFSSLFWVLIHHPSRLVTLTTFIRNSLCIGIYSKSIIKSRVNTTNYAHTPYV